MLNVSQGSPESTATSWSSACTRPPIRPAMKLACAARFSSAACARSISSVTNVHADEERHPPGLERVVRAHHEQTVFPDQSFEQLGAVAKVVDRGAHVGANRLVNDHVHVQVLS